MDTGSAYGYTLRLAKTAKIENIAFIG